jgi:hypothetical protein
MPSRIDDLLSHIAQLERELEKEVNRARDRWRYQIERALGGTSPAPGWRAR